jgi:hypothetical protein
LGDVDDGEEEGEPEGEQGEAPDEKAGDQIALGDSAIHSAALYHGFHPDRVIAGGSRSF